MVPHTIRDGCDGNCDDNIPSRGGRIHNGGVPRQNRNGDGGGGDGGCSRNIRKGHTTTEELRMFGRRQASPKTP